MKTFTTMKAPKKCYCVIWDDERNTHYEAFWYLKDAKEYAKHRRESKIYRCIDGKGEKRML
ncbi:MAG: hypothetical protein WC373_17500 [Smithella sp.]